MADLSSNRIAWTYTDDNGHAWRVAALKAWTDQGSLGGAAAARAIFAKPASIKMRRISVSDGVGHSRVLPVYEAPVPGVSPPIAFEGAAFNFNANVAGVITTVTGFSTGKVISEGRGRASNVTKQST